MSDFLTTETLDITTTFRPAGSVPPAGPIAWNNTNPEVATLAPAADGLSATLTPIEAGTVADITFTDGTLSASTGAIVFASPVVEATGVTLTVSVVPKPAA